MRDGGLATDTEDVTRAGRGRGDQPRPARVRGHYIVDQTRLVQQIDLLTLLLERWMLQTNFSRFPKLPSQASVLPPGRRQTGDRRRKVVMLDEFDLEHGAGTCTRAANEPS